MTAVLLHYKFYLQCNVFYFDELKTVPYTVVYLHTTVP